MCGKFVAVISIKSGTIHKNRSFNSAAIAQHALRQINIRIERERKGERERNNESDHCRSCWPSDPFEFHLFTSTDQFLP